MTQDVQWIRKALIQRKEYDALQKEIETLRIELLAADYEAEHASGWFTAKKKQALIEKRDILQARLSPLEKNLQAAITNKTINLSPVLPLLPAFLDHDARYRNQLRQFNQKALLANPLRLRRVDFARLSLMDKRSELRFLGKQCQPLKAELQTILRKLEDQAICLISELTGPRKEN